MRKRVALASTKGEVHPEGGTHRGARTETDAIVALEAPEAVEESADAPGVVEERSGNEFIDPPAVFCLDQQRTAIAEAERSVAAQRPGATKSSAAGKTARPGPLSGVPMLAQREAPGSCVLDKGEVVAEIGLPAQGRSSDPISGLDSEQPKSVDAAGEIVELRDPPWRIR